jgi:hypothetical protein
LQNERVQRNMLKSQQSSSQFHEINEEVESALRETWESRHRALVFNHRSGAYL